MVTDLNPIKECVNLSEQSVWNTWKPYAIIGAIAVGGFWWYSSQSPMATLKDGAYDCVGVYVNESGKLTMAA